eukprot:485156-Pelagomonas_calceolata.AAC.4
MSMYALPPDNYLLLFAHRTSQLLATFCAQVLAGTQPTYDSCRSSHAAHSEQLQAGKTLTHVHERVYIASQQKLLYVCTRVLTCSPLRTAVGGQGIDT